MLRTPVDLHGMGIVPGSKGADDRRRPHEVHDKQGDADGFDRRHVALVRQRRLRVAGTPDSGLRSWLYAAGITAIANITVAAAWT
ncbi:hypothetical protein [Puerhibacterium puerhi]|uniref:hypothetical protein n=1 Tax=Puerhibacterium puerhi TaxID=2692623 RepID=UPI00135C0BFE|nr:hypothetical protein [Puerhibacterium puerhi]